MIINNTTYNCGTIYLGLSDEIPEKKSSNYREYYWMSANYVNAIRWCEENDKVFKVSNAGVNSSNFDDFQRYVNTVETKVLTYATRVLNEYHKTYYSSHQWRILIGHWIGGFVRNYYDKYLKIKDVLQDKEDYYLKLFNVSELYVTLDNWEYMWSLQSLDADRFCRYQYSLLLNEMNYLDTNDSEAFYKKRLDSHKAPPEYVISFRNELNKVKKDKELSDFVVIRNPYIKWELVTEIIGDGNDRIAGYFYDYINEFRSSISINIDSDWRMANDKELEDKSDDQFVSLIYKLFKKEIPIVYLERFQLIKDKSREIYKYAIKPNAVIFESGVLLYDELFKIYLMKIDRNNNIKRISVQHGGNYGISSNPFLDWEFEFSDIFFTAGWNSYDSIIDKNTEFVPMPFIKFFRMEKQNSIRNKIIYISYWDSKYIHYHDKHDVDIVNIKKKELNGLKQLSKEVIKDFLYRGYPISDGWKFIDDIRNEVDGINIDEEKDYYKSIGRAKLIVCEVISTTFIEALHCGVPTIVIYDPNEMAFNVLTAAKDDIEDMKKVGIIVGNIEGMSELINRIYMDIDGWWNEPERQEVVKRIKRKYAWFPDDARNIWINTIRSYAE